MFSFSYEKGGVVFSARELLTIEEAIKACGKVENFFNGVMVEGKNEVVEQLIDQTPNPMTFTGQFSDIIYKIETAEGIHSYLQTLEEARQAVANLNVLADFGLSDDRYSEDDIRILHGFTITEKFTSLPNGTIITASDAKELFPNENTED